MVKKSKGMRLRIVGGTLRGRVMMLPPEFQGRPTKDMVREAFFDIIGDFVIRANFLDLCCGSGATGIEAISRGARHSWLVDRDFVACKVAREAVKTFKVDESVTVEKMDAGSFVSQASANKLFFDIIFCDPPYEITPEKLSKNLEQMPSILAPEGILIIEHDEETEYPEGLFGLSRFKEKKYGGTKLTFYSRPVPGDL